MGLNKIYFGFRKYKIYPRYYVAINQEVISQSVEQIRLLKCVNFISAQDQASPLKESAFTHWIKADLPVLGFSRDLCNGVHQGWTVTHVALQIAYFMGFEQIIIVGMDHRYQFTGKPNEIGYHEGFDPNHFSQDYFKDCLWNNPDLAGAEDAYKIARHVYEAAGRSIVDCTVDGACQVFEKRRLDEML